MKRIKTKVQGVRYREHETRKHGLQPDKYFTIRYRVDGKEKEEGLGWASEGWTVARAADTIAELKRNARTGEGVTTLSGKRKAAVAAEQAEIDRIKIEHESSEIEAKEAVHLSVIFNEYYIIYTSEHKKQRTIESEKHLFKNWISPVIGNKPLKDISSFDCERIKKAMRIEGKSDRTIEYALAVLRQIFTYARKFKKYAGSNPLDDVVKLKYDNRKQRFLTASERDLLMETLKQRNIQLYHIALVSFHSGLRAGEIFALTWADIDIENGLLLLKDTKNSETRYAFMTNELKRELSSMTPGKPSELLFKNKDGDKIKSISSTWDRIINDLGFNDHIIDRRQRFTFHSLRHSFASNCVESGVDLYKVQLLLGHKTSRMTMRYSHMRADSLRAAVLQMERGQQTAEVIPMIGRAG